MGGGTHGRHRVSMLLRCDRLFEPATWIRKLLAPQDLSTLRHRLSLKLSGARRGRLYLPAHFPPEVQALSSLGKTQLRNAAFALTAQNAGHRSLDKRTSDFVRQVYPDGQIRTCTGKLPVHLRQKSKVLPCSESDWPRHGTRAVWPSTPTLIESVDMAARGLTPLAINRRSEPVKHRISLAQFNSLAGLRARVINTNIVGIRSDVEVPEKYLGYFRYRWGFLILNCGYRMPTGLVRFLTAQWIKGPHNLWLRDKCSFKNFLKKSDFRTYSPEIPGPW